MKIISTLAKIAAISGFTYVAYQVGQQFLKLRKIDYEFKRYAIKKITRKFIAIDTVVTVINPTDLDVMIQSYDINIFLNGKYVGKSKYKKPQMIKANTRTDIIIEIGVNLKQYFNLSEILQLSALVLKAPSKVKFHYEGLVKIKHSIVTATIPVKIDYSLKEMLED